LAKSFNRLPHEFAFGRVDVPGEDLPLAAIVWDIQALNAFVDEEKRLMEEAQRRARRR